MGGQYSPEDHDYSGGSMTLGCAKLAVGLTATVPLTKRQKPPEEEEAEEKFFSDRWSGELNAWGSHMTRQELLFLKGGFGWNGSYIRLKKQTRDKKIKQQQPNYQLFICSVIQNILSMKICNGAQIWAWGIIIIVYFLFLEINSELSRWL